MTSVFVSYYEDASEDYAKQIHKILTERHLDVYVDHIITKNKSGYIQKNIDAAIDRCDIFVLLNTIGSLDRDEVIREFKRAFPACNFTKPKLFIFRDISVGVPRVTDKFKAETSVDLSKLHQRDFKNVNDLTRQILDAITFSSARTESEPTSSLSPPSMRVLPIRKKFVDIFNAYPKRIKEIIIDIETLLEATNVNYALIEQKAKAILSSDPSNLYAKNVLGIVYGIYKKYTDAESLFSDVISMKKNVSIGYNNRAICLYYRGQYYDALEDMNKAVELDSKDIDFINFKGSIHFKLEQYEEAMECYETSLSLETNNFSALVGKAVLLLDNNRAEALTLLKKAKKINERDPSLWYNLGILYVKDENYDEALGFFKNAIKHDNGDYIVLSLLQIGVVYRRQLLYDKALDTYDELISFAPGNSEVYYNKGVALGYMQRHAEALRCFEKTLELDPLNQRAMLNKATSLTNLNRANDALIEVDKLLRVNSNDLQGFELKGHILFKKRSFKAAQKIAQNLVQRMPQNIEYVLNLCHVLNEQKKYKEYLKLIKISLRRFPIDERLNSNLAHVYLCLHKPKPALEICVELTERNPTLALAHYNKACAFCLLNKKNEAISSLKRAIQLDMQFLPLAKSDKDLESIRELKSVKKLIGT